MIRKLIYSVLLLGGVAVITWALWGWHGQNRPTPEAQPIAIGYTSTTMVEPSSTTTLADLLASSSTTAPPPPKGDEQVICAAPVELRIYFGGTQQSMLKAPIDVSESRFDPAKNRVDIHISAVNGLPCADTSLPVKLLGHKQQQFCYLVLEPNGFDPCEYGVELGDAVEVVLEDGQIVTYEVVEPLHSDIARPLSEVYPAIENPSPAVMFRKFTEYQLFYDEIFSREDASDELWLFTSCGNDIQGGHSQDACAVRTEFRNYTGTKYTPAGAEIN